jgi:glycosyltransferase involved in cell wall biosynthesis
MYSVYEGLYTYLPSTGVEIVSDKEDADVLNPHIGMWGDFPSDIPIVVSSHGMLWEEHGWGRIAKKVNEECLTAYRRADVITAPSRFVARSISRYTGASPVVVHHGINPDKWRPAKTKGYVLWNKIRSDVASNPIDMNRLAELAPDTVFYSTHGNEADNVFLFGAISSDDMYDMVSQAGVYLATAKESGGPCFGVLEAMSCAVPVLSWDFGGTAEAIVHKETGYLAKPFDYGDLLEGLYYCVEHRDRLGNNARQTVINHYQWEHVIHGYIAAYERAVVSERDKVVVIIPCHNLGNFLPFCLDSVLEQDYPNFEVMVIDDASTDNSAEIIEQYVAKDSRIRALYLEKNQHVSFARNIGIESSNAEFILPLDADDRLYSDAISRLVNELQQDRSIDIAAGKLHIYHETDLEGDYQVSGWPNNTSLKLQLEGYNRLPYSSMYRGKVFERVGGYRTRIKNGTEDADFWTRALSLGYKAEIFDFPALKYTYREQSLGKTNTKGSSAWLNWFPWVEENSPARAFQVTSFDQPRVSIIIPVGPGHLGYIKSCVDSVIAQTLSDWEIIVVNDTGVKLQDKHIYGMGFVRYIEYEGSHGVAYARNRGVEEALADKIVFLDVDDTLQPHALHVLLAAHEYAGGWIYGDWYANTGEGEIKYSEASDWDYNLILTRSLGPITGVYEKKHVELVGGFTEDLPGWEDWDFHLKLLHHGICGTRVKTPLITYNMHLGWRREDNFIKRDNLVEYIRETHYNTLKDRLDMGCSSCGGKRTLTVKTDAKTGTDMNMDDLVQIRYAGVERGRNRINSKTHPGTAYKFSSGKPIFYVFKGDLEYLMSFRTASGQLMFEIVEEVVSPPEPDIYVEEEPLVSEDVPAQYIPVELIEVLDLEEHVVEKLREAGYGYTADIISASDNDLLQIKGIGQQRVAEIREAVTQWQLN